ncbi:helix-turn-helix transcriptional regulator [Nocardioides sp. WS12]|uniref:helix-turn-helix domain-containing protein n=1 Tax=Nocardioides sp. WS12 TaxID=2486272 RepID=UPI0015FDDA6A|nr:helix-turn-helix transcriptional regulator [Nocardioides sp. WS12]
MDVRLAELSRSIDAAELGRRIRAARVAAGMTQAQLAGGEVSAAYISRIEDGQRRPAAHLLGRMAARMNTTLHQLLMGFATTEARQLELQVEHAAVSLVLGETADALAEATTAAARLERFGDPALLAEAMRIKAEAQRAVGDLESAVAILEALTEDLSPDMNTLRALITLCRCYCERDQLTKAVATGDLAQRMAARLGIGGLGETLQIAAVRAEALLRRGDQDAAAVICREVLDGLVGDGSQLSSATSYWRASISESAANGATPAAIELAKVAHTLIDIAERRTTIDHLTKLSTA